MEDSQETKQVEEAGKEPCCGSALLPAGSAGTEVKNLIDQYQRLEKMNGVLRAVFPLLVLAIIAIIGATTWKNIEAAFTEKRVTDATVKAGEELLPVFNRLVEDFVKEVGPILSAAFSEHLETYTLQLGERLGKHLDDLERRNKGYLENQTQAAVQAQKAQHRKLLLEVMPELANEPEKLDELANRLNRAFELWTVKYMLSMLEDYYIVIAKINDTVTKSFRMKPGELSSSERATREGDMMELFMEILHTSFAEEPIAPGALPEVGKTEPKPDDPPATETPAAPAPEGAEAAPAPVATETVSPTSGN
jgi:hypothetical protein